MDSEINNEPIDNNQLDPLNQVNPTIPNENVSENVSENKPCFEIEHIYNGIIFTDSEFFPLIEFKIISSMENAFIFDRVNFKCAWFVINMVDEVLEGPIQIDTELIKTGKRIVKDPTFKMIDGLSIDAVSNYDIIRDIPTWMMESINKSVIERQKTQ